MQNKAPEEKRIHLLRRLVVAVLHGLESVTVVLANLGRRTPRVYERYPSWDLLKAHRIAQLLHNGDQVLDVGCGNGHVLDELGLFRTLERTGIDLAPGQAPSGVRILPYDGQLLPFADASFDVTMFCYVLHHLTREHARRLLDEAIRVSRRQVILIEDTLPEFGVLYRLRNHLHRVGTEIEYGAASSTYQPVGGQPMFLTHAGWREFLVDVPGAGEIEIESLERLCKYAHHTLVTVKRAAPTRGPTHPDRDPVLSVRV